MSVDDEIDDLEHRMMKMRVDETTPPCEGSLLITYERYFQELVSRGFSRRRTRTH